MPVDTGIFNLLGRGVKSVAEYDAEAQQAQMNKLNLLRARQQMAEQQALDGERSELAKIMPTLDRKAPDAMQRLYQVAPRSAPAVIKQWQDQDKTDAEIADKKSLTADREFKSQKDRYLHGVSLLQGAQTPEEALRAVDEGIKLGAWDREKATGMVQAMKAAHDSGDFRGWQQLYLKTVLSPEKLLPQVQNRDTGGAIQTLAIDPLTGKPSVTGSVAKTMSPEQVDASKRGWAQFGETRRHNLVSEGFRAQELTTGREEKVATKKAEAVEKAVTKFSDTIQKEGIPELETAVAQAENALGRYKPGQVPGVGPIKNALPAALMSAEGKDVRQALAQVRNIVLSARSGAAVTDQELRRLVEEIGTGAGMDDADIRRGLQKVRARLDQIKTNAAAGVSDEVLNTYRERGGLDIRRGGKPEAAQRTVVRTGTHNGRKVVQYSDGTVDYAN